ncbi:MAG: hypothetical protein JNM72_27445 [Deltaproteobacteria bacterium]|nr:hypothetical protein [Deltaproteobacteria bacterium]
MNLDPTTPLALGVELGLLTPDGAPSLPGVADLLREAAQRWGPTPRRDLQELALGQLDRLGAGRPTPLVNAALDALIDLRELIPVSVPALDYGAGGPVDALSLDAEPAALLSEPAARQRRSARVLAPCAPAVVRLGDRALLLGAATPAHLTPLRSPEEHVGGVVGRWITLAEASALLRDEALDPPLLELDHESWALDATLAAAAQARVEPDEPEARAEAERAAGEPEAFLAEAQRRDLDRYGAPVDDDRWISVYCKDGPVQGSPKRRTGGWRAAAEAPDGVWRALMLPERGRPRAMLARVAGGRVERVIEVDLLV